MNHILKCKEIRILHWLTLAFVVALLGLGNSACSNNSEPEKRPTHITLILGGENCEFYLGAVKTALNKLKGVKEVDLSTQKGQAVIKTDGTLQSSQIVDAVNSLSGEGWNCEAEFQK